MKKKLVLTILMLAIILGIPAQAADTAQPPVTVMVEGKALNLAGKQPYEQEGITMVPVRAVAEALDYTVGWVALRPNEIRLSNGAVDTTLTIGQDLYAIARSGATGGSNPAPLGAAPAAAGGVTYVPAGLFEVLGNSMEQKGNVISFTGKGDANQRVQDLVSGDFNEGKMELRCFIFPGTGPWVLTLDEAEYGTQVRNIFAAYDWQSGDGEREVTSGGYWVDIHCDDHAIRLESGSDTLVYLNGMYYASFHAADAGQLCDRLTGLYPGPEIRLTQTPAAGAGSIHWTSAAEAFMKAFGETYRESGAITAFTLRSINRLELEVANTYLIFRAVYAVKPTDSTQAYWQGKTADKDGWVELQNDIELTQISGESGGWSCTYFDAWSDTE